MIITGSSSQSRSGGGFSAPNYYQESLLRYTNSKWKSFWPDMINSAVPGLTQERMIFMFISISMEQTNTNTTDRAKAGEPDVSWTPCRLRMTVKKKKRKRMDHIHINCFCHCCSRLVRCTIFLSLYSVTTEVKLNVDPAWRNPNHPLFVVIMKIHHSPSVKLPISTPKTANHSRQVRQPGQHQNEPRPLIGRGTMLACSGSATEPWYWDAGTNQREALTPTSDGGLRWN